MGTCMTLSSTRLSFQRSNFPATECASCLSPELPSVLASASCSATHSSYDRSLLHIFSLLACNPISCSIRLYLCLSWTQCTGLSCTPIRDLRVTRKLDTIYTGL